MNLDQFLPPLIMSETKSWGSSNGAYGIDWGYGTRNCYKRDNRYQNMSSKNFIDDLSWRYSNTPQISNLSSSSPSTGVHISLPKPLIGGFRYNRFNNNSNDDDGNTKNNNVVNEKKKLTLIPLMRPSFSDVTVVVGEGRGILYPLHRLVLCACSDFFNAALTGPWNCARTETLDLRYIDALTPLGFEAVVNHMYTGRLVTDAATLTVALKTASYLQMNDLVGDIVNQLKSTCTRDNVFDLFSLGISCCAFDLVSYASTYITYYWDELIAMRGTMKKLAEIPGAQMVQILGTDTVYAKDEFQFYKALVERAKLRKKILYQRKQEQQRLLNTQKKANNEQMDGSSVKWDEMDVEQKLELQNSAIKNTCDVSGVNIIDTNNQNPDTITPNSERESWDNGMYDIRDYSYPQGNTSLIQSGILSEMKIGEYSNNASTIATTAFSTDDGNSNNNNNNNNNNSKDNNNANINPNYNNGDNIINNNNNNNTNGDNNNRNLNNNSNTGACLNKEKNSEEIENKTVNCSSIMCNRKLCNINQENDDGEEATKLSSTKVIKLPNTEDICSGTDSIEDKTPRSFIGERTEKRQKQVICFDSFYAEEPPRPLEVEDEETQESRLFDFVMLESMTSEELKLVYDDGMISDGRILDRMFAPLNRGAENEDNGSPSDISLMGGDLYNRNNNNNNNNNENEIFDRNDIIRYNRNNSTIDDMAQTPSSVTPEVSPFFTVYPKTVLVESPQLQGSIQKVPLISLSNEHISGVLDSAKERIGTSYYRKKLTDKLWTEKMQNIYNPMSSSLQVPIPQKRFSCSTSIYWDIPAILSKQDRRDSLYGEEGQPRYIRSDFMQDSRGRVFTCVVYPFGAKNDNIMSAYIYSHPSRVPRNSRYFNLVSDNNYSWLSKFRIVAMIAGTEYEGYTIESIQHVFCNETNNWGWSEYLTLSKANDLHLIDANTNRIRLRVSIVSYDTMDDK